ncbi:phospho-sugar mutase [Clostridium polynesiense]|uniref:phospho-sugar mutase n=1 Tax=Clostridium polynesiense TaxID=1325933 RepID=UPI00058C6343|nr:phospho-sugar mutase [Clostridium polynesiense]
MNYKDRYNYWMNSDIIDEKFKTELKSIMDDSEIEDRFYKDLDFGTGGLRGVIGAGSNRMNKYTVSKATQGLADYINSNCKGNKAVAIAYDSRNKSSEFARAAALTLCANNIKVYLYESLRPTPMLSFTVRYLNCSAGIVITASHNPKQYNGYKVYESDGGQVTDQAAKEILSYINKIDKYEVIKSIREEDALGNNYLQYIGEDIDKEYIKRVMGLSIRKEMVDKAAEDLKIIYTPIHGSGNLPVRAVFRELGYKNLYVVKEQENPDGDFPTAPYPNPEDPKVFSIALDMAKEVKPDIIFGTDPDCDRIGVVVKDNTGEYKVLTGNETGMLLTNYIIEALKEGQRLPENGVVVKTIVTTDSVRKMCEDNGIELLEVLTGFKYIGEKIKEYEKSREKTFLFGFEESYGYLAGDFVRDKDAVIASMLISEMALYYKSLGKNLYDALIDLYDRYGYYKENLLSIELKGIEGQKNIINCIDYFRNSEITEINNVKVNKKIDYKLSVSIDYDSKEKKSISLPKSNVIKLILQDDSWIVIRPSGTEPKMKIYLSVKGAGSKEAEFKMEKLKNYISKIIDDNLN